MDRRRPPKKRPSNVITYVLLSIAALFGLFIFGKVLQAFDRESTAPRPGSAIALARSYQEIDVRDTV